MVGLLDICYGSLRSCSFRNVTPHLLIRWDCAFLNAAELLPSPFTLILLYGPLEFNFTRFWGVFSWRLSSLCISFFFYFKWSYCFPLKNTEFCSGKKLKYCKFTPSTRFGNCSNFELFPRRCLYFKGMFLTHKKELSWHFKLLSPKCSMKSLHSD